MNYGAPYKGSKNTIAAELVKHIPHPKGCTHFYDLFAGGCAVTHALMLQRAFGYYHVNDIDGKAIRLFCDAVNGKYADEKRWISREDFSKLKDTDPYVSVCWSFGNNMKNYLYSCETEQWKKALHWARVYGDTSLLEEFGIKSDGSRADIVKHMDEYKQLYIRWMKSQNMSSEELDELSAKSLQRLQRLQRLESLESLQMLQRLQSLQRLQRLQSLQRLVEPTFLSYNQVPIEPNSVIYCDVPYKGTSGYSDTKDTFGYEAFYDWCEKQTNLTLISEYSMPEDRFTCVWATEKTRNLCTRSRSTKAVERLYVPKGQEQMYYNMLGNTGGAQLSLFKL